jgi:hypothetical protein
MGLKTASTGAFLIPTAPAVGTTVASGAANTYTTNAVQLIASTGAAIFIIGLHVQLSSTSKPTYVAVRLSTGAGDGSIVGEYVVPYASTAGAAGTQMMGYIPINPPIPVANATRIGCKTADSVGSLSHTVILSCINQANVVDDGIIESTNVLQWNSTNVASPATAGVPDVNVKNAGNIAWASGSLTSGVFAAGAINAAAIADAAIDRATFAADTGLQTIRSGTAQAGGTGNITLDAGASSIDDFYKGRVVLITGGAGAGGASVIYSYTGSTKAALYDPVMAVAPDGTSTFAILPLGLADVRLWQSARVTTPGTAGVPNVDIQRINNTGQAAVELAQFCDTMPVNSQLTSSGCTTTSVTTNSGLFPFSVLTNQFVGCILVFQRSTTTAGLRGVCAVVTANTSGTGPTFTVTPALPATPASGETYTIIPARATVDVNNDKTSYQLAADQAVNVTKVNGTSQTARDLGAQLDAAVSTRLAAASAPANFSALGITAGGHVSNVDTLTTYTGNTVQTGDAFARLGAPASASVSADVAAVKSDSGAIKTQTDKLTFTVSGVVDSNVVDWKGATAPAMTGDAFARLGAPAGASVSADVAAVKSDSAAIKLKTDNLPASPAAVSDIPTASAIRTEMDTSSTKLAHLDADVSTRMASYTQPSGFLAASFPASVADESLIIAATNSILSDTATIKGKTNNLPASPAATSDIPTVVDIRTEMDSNSTRLAHVDVDVSTRLAAADYISPDESPVLTAIAALNNVSAADVWAYTTRELTSGNNIVLAKGTGITGFNDLDAAGVRGAVGLAAANLDAQLDALPTADENADAKFDQADAIETGLTERQALRLLCAMLGGKVSGAGSGHETFRNAAADSKDRAVIAADANGNRTAVTLDLT